jgi:outer membrane immunogenic protein
MRRRWLLGLVSGLVLAGAAHGADMATAPVFKAPPAPPPANWAGLYLGVQGGAVRHDAWFNDMDQQAATQSTAQTGGIFGGYAGYNWQDRSFVYGVEADISGIAAKAQETWLSGVTYLTPQQQSQEVPWLATFRGRMGLDYESTLFYFTGGLAVGQVKNSDVFNCYATRPCGVVPAGGTIASFSEDATRVGWTTGVGIEHMFTSHLTLRGELRYVDLGKKTVSCADTVPGLFCTAPGALFRGEFSNTLTIGTVGLGYKF